MSRTTMTLAFVSISCVLLALIVISGCTSASSGSMGTNGDKNPSVPSQSETTTSASTAAPYQQDDAGTIGIMTIYGKSSNPSAGIDEFLFPIDLQTPSVDLTKWELLYGITPSRGAAPTSSKIYLYGTSSTTGTFTATLDKKPVSTLTREAIKNVGQLPEISFKVDPPAPKGTFIICVLRPLGSTTDFSKYGMKNVETVQIPSQLQKFQPLN